MKGKVTHWYIFSFASLWGSFLQLYIHSIKDRIVAAVFGLPHGAEQVIVTTDAFCAFLSGAPNSALSAVLSLEPIYWLRKERFALKV
jgi:hypothetical protein